jgi:phenylpyruvate tautomerase
VTGSPGRIAQSPAPEQRGATFNPVNTWLLILVVLEPPGTRLKEAVMPYLLIQTNQPLGDVEQNQLLADASKIVAAALNKPEKYVMVAWAPAPKMIFDSGPAGAAFLELQSIGIPESGREKIPGALAKCMAEHLGISPDRVYLVMVDVPAKYWGQGEQTFG